MSCSKVPRRTVDAALPVAVEGQGEQPGEFSQDVVAVAAWVPHGSPRPTVTQHPCQSVHLPMLLPPVQSSRRHPDRREEVAGGGV